MPGPVQRQGDPNTAGGLIIGGDQSVLVNGRPIATPGLTVTPHPPCGRRAPQHCVAKTKSRTTTVFVNGKPVLTSGDSDTCSHGRNGSGSPNVRVG